MFAVPIFRQSHMRHEMRRIESRLRTSTKVHFPEKTHKIITTFD